MRNVIKIILCVSFISILTISCKKDPEVITGCTDKQGDNYDPNATEDNGSCTFQKRFLGDYDGLFTCKGVFATAFSMAPLSVTELIKKDEVNIIIQSAIGPLPVMGKLTKDTVFVDALLPNVKVRVGDVIAGGGDAQVLCDGKVKTKLAISADNKILTGVIALELVTKEATVVGGLFPIPAGYKLEDNCDFTGTKK